jgi:hypothetical protein
LNGPQQSFGDHEFPLRIDIGRDVVCDTTRVVTDTDAPSMVRRPHRPFARPLWIGIYEGHFKKRATISGEYQGRSGVIVRVMQPGKNWAQYAFFSASVLA